VFSTTMGSQVWVPVAPSNVTGLSVNLAVWIWIGFLQNAWVMVIKGEDTEKGAEADGGGLIGQNEAVQRGLPPVAGTAVGIR